MKEMSGMNMTASNIAANEEVSVVKKPRKVDRVKRETAKTTPETVSRVKPAGESAKPLRCPRCEDDVYSIAISLQYYTGAKYLELADRNLGAAKGIYTSLAMRQLDIKEAIAKIANDKLNLQLHYFYNNGGPAMDI
jgi:hypothetical protein